jgi:hypothetical protein
LLEDILNLLTSFLQSRPACCTHDENLIVLDEIPVCCARR